MWLQQLVDCVHWKLSGNGPVPSPSPTAAPALVSQTQVVFSIVAPAFVISADANWDCHIEIHPEMNGYSTGDYVSYNHWLGLNATGPNMGGITMKAALSSYAASNGLGCLNLADNLNYADVGQFSIQQPQTQQEGHMTSMCVKYVDATAKLYDSGMVHAYRSPPVDVTNPSTLSFCNGGNLPAYSGYGTALASNLRKAPPSDLSTLSLLPTYSNHKVQDGMFMTVMIDPTQRAELPDFVAPVYIKGDWNNPYTGGYNAPLIFNNNSLPANGFTISPQSHTGVVPTGIYLQGLNPKHQGLLTVNYVWTSYPSPQMATESTFVSLLTEGTPIDPVCMEIASCILAHAPVMGVAKDNDLWTWLGKTFNAIGPAAAGILSMIPHPAAQIGSKAIGMLAPGVQNLTQQRQASNKKKKSGNKQMSMQKYYNANVPLPALPAPSRAQPPRPPPLPARTRAAGYSKRVVPNRNRRSNRVFHEIRPGVTREYVGF